MIRFSCPGCGATYSVDDTKGGKTGKCPKCQTQFQIPMPEGAPAPAAVGSGPAPTLPPPSADPNAPVEIAPCPGCQARLSVATSDLGADVECPYCKTVYKAKKPGTGTSPVSPSRRSELDEDRPSRRRRDEEEEEDDRPSRRRRRDEVDEEEEEDDRPRRRRRDEEEEEDRPRKRKRRRGGSYAPHRGVTILIFGILGWAVCLIFGIMAWVMGNADIKAMDEGRMDPEGRGMTQIGRIMGMVQCILALICVPVYIGLIFLGALGGK